MSLSDVIPVETVNMDDNQKDHENAEDEEDDNKPPPLRKREVDDGENSEETSEVGPSIDWDLADLIPEFRKTYQDEEGRQIRHN